MHNIGILYGGRSDEHDVSRCSAASVVDAMDRSRFNPVAIGIERNGHWQVQDEPIIVPDPEFGRKLDLRTTGTWYCNHFEDQGKLTCIEQKTGRRVSVDAVFPVVHGTFCEDGALQGLLELSLVPFVGAGTAGSAIGMDKDVAKRLLRDAGIPVTPWITVRGHTWTQDPQKIRETVERDFGYPVFVKPSGCGSSVGVVKVNGPNELDQGIQYALSYDAKVLVEKGISAREIECSVLGNDTPETSVLGEIIPRHEFYSYEAKYLDPDGAQLVIPADIDQTVAESIRTHARTAFQVLECSGLARIDFFLDRDTGEYYLNEINTLPGFTSVSMYPKLWESSGIPYRDLITRLIDLAFERNRLFSGYRRLDHHG